MLLKESLGTVRIQIWRGAHIPSAAPPWGPHEAPKVPKGFQRFPRRSRRLPKVLEHSPGSEGFQNFLVFPEGSYFSNIFGWVVKHISCIQMVLTISSNIYIFFTNVDSFFFVGQIVRNRYGI